MEIYYIEQPKPTDNNYLSALDLELDPKIISNERDDSWDETLLRGQGTIDLYASWRWIIVMIIRIKTLFDFKINISIENGQ